MKRLGNVWEKVISDPTIEYAYNRAKKGKMWQKKIRRIDQNKEEYLKKLKESLVDRTFHTSLYRTKWIYEPKAREIYILPFYPDRIVQHAVMAHVAPDWDRRMFYHSYSCRVGKGQHAGSQVCMQFTRRNKYCLQCDVSKFYPSIVHDILYDEVCDYVKDPNVLWLLKDIIYSGGGVKNVPIGNYTSQWFGNLYLTPLDWRVKHEHRIHDYLRYCDDFLLFENDKTKLQHIANDLEQYLLNEYGLTLSKRELFHTSQGVDFLGYRHFPDGKILVRKTTAKRIRKNLSQIPYLYQNGFITAEQALSKVASANGWLKYAQTHNLKIAMEFSNLEEEVRSYGSEIFGFCG